MIPTIGRIVIYNSTNEQLKAMEDSYKNTGKGCNIQSKLPAIIVAVWSDIMVNLKVITDGQDDLWVTSSHLGDGAGEWNWPVKQE
jgi:hypothetical protein